MANNLLSGLGKFGLGNLQEMKLYEEPEEKKAAAKEGPKVVEETDFLFAKSFDCPVCHVSFTDLSLRSSKARLLGTGDFLRAKYDNIDPYKYGVVSCPECGYTVLSRYFAPLSGAIANLIKTNISQSFIKRTTSPATLSYDDAFERHQLCLANTVVKKAKDSEKADVCLKTSYILRGMAESLNKEDADYADKLKEIEEAEQEFLKNAYDGFSSARTAESYPISGMKEEVLDYLLAALAINFKQFDAASRMISSILTNQTAASSIKEKARDLKEVLLKEKK
ncbi:MAG: DUF2225 domain-containing protein [Lachnospiraceae bacterium]|nr:DUF2225 domain-containing protein [Lachnospiraceae bacterium]